MKLSSAKKLIPPFVYSELDKLGFDTLRPSQIKSINAGLFNDKNLLVCTPTASGKTLVGEMGILNSLHKNGSQKSSPSSSSRSIAVYVVPLRALASEKFRSFSKRYPKLKVTLTSGDMDSDDRYLMDYDIIITTSEKLDSLIRHNAPWLSMVSCLVVDEIHLLNDHNRGPTLEILLTILRKQNPSLQIIGLSATIGNPEALAKWLDAELVVDDWRPVALHKGVLFDDKIHFPEE